MKKGIIALSLGTFAFGMTEYVMMSILPDLARDFGCSITEAGHLISSYALGVCVGAPLVALFFRNWPLQRILVMLMAVYAVGNLWFAVSPDYLQGLVCRFVSGLPHGAFFGAGSIVASRLMPGKETTAVALMTLGMTLANLVGIPLGSYVANTFDWRWIFFFNAALGLATFLSILFLVKGVGSLPHTDIKGEFKFLSHLAPWLLIFATIFCQGGAFSMYSYVSPIMEHAGLALEYMPLMMIVVGFGMVAGNYYSGVLSDRYTPQRITLWVAVIMTLSLIATYFDSFNMWVSGTTVTLVAACLFALSSPMQLLLIKYSPGGELMGGAMVQVAFNLGNAIGAYFGGLPIDAGKSPETASLVGAAMSAVSILIVFYFIRRYRRAS